MTVTADICVVGGGPAGAAAAIVASRAGRDVVLVDRARFPRDKACGDGLTIAAVDTLERLGVHAADVGSWTWISGVKVRSPRGYTAEFPSSTDGGGAAAAPRIELDAALLRTAGRAGTRLLDGVALTGLRQDDGFVDVATTGPPIRARWVVAADGMWSPTARCLGVTPVSYRGEWHVVRQYLRVRSAPTAMLVWYERELLPAYAWAFPVGRDLVNFGFGVWRGRANRPPASRPTMDRLLALPHVRAALGDVEAVGPLRAWPVPARLGRSVVARGRVLFAGDACGATDPLTGEGIGPALVTGAIAGDTLSATAGAPETVVRTYERAVHKLVARDHRLGGLLLGVVGRPAALDASLRILGSRRWTRRQFGRWLLEAYPHALLFTPDRWLSAHRSVPNIRRAEQGVPR